MTEKKIWVVFYKTVMIKAFDENFKAYNYLLDDLNTRLETNLIDDVTYNSCLETLDETYENSETFYTGYLTVRTIWVE